MAAPKGFVSKKQWRWAFATHQAFAVKKAHETATPFKALPRSKHSGGQRVKR